MEMEKHYKGKRLTEHIKSKDDKADEKEIRRPKKFEIKRKWPKRKGSRLR